MTEFLERLNSRNGRRALLFLFLLSALIFSIVPLVNLAAGRGAKDYKLWYSIGQTVRHGGAIYPHRTSAFPSCIRRPPRKCSRRSADWDRPV